MKGVFVLSGKYQSAEEIIPLLSVEEQPEMVCADIQAYEEAL
jgi:hypothetical protein